MISFGNHESARDSASGRSDAKVDAFEKHRMETIYGSVANTIPAGTRPDLEVVRAAAGLATAGANINLSRYGLPDRSRFIPG